MIVAEVDSMHGNVENNSKKSKKRKAHALEDGHDNEVNGRRNETVDEIVDVSLQMEINQKQRKNKRKLELNEKEADFTNAQTKMSSNLSREDEKKRKKKHKRDSKHDEARVLRGSLEVNSSLQEKQLKNNDLGGESNAYSTPSNSQVTVDKKDEKSKKRKKKKKAKSLEEKKIDDNDVDVTSNSQVNSSLQEKQLENNDLDGESNAHSTPSNSQVTVDKKDEKSKKTKKAKSVEEKQLENIDVDGESNAYSTPSNSQVTVDKKDEKSKKKKKKKKKAKSVEEKKINDNDVDGESNANSTQSKSHDGKKRKKSKLVDTGSENPKSKGRSKRVSFSGHVEVFPSSDTDTERGAAQNDGVVQGKRFTREEDEIIKKAIEKYIEEHGLGEEGLNMILHCKDHREVRFCWREIGAAIPYRPKDAIYYRAHILYERSERREWTEEEIATLKELHKKYGNSWKMAAKELGKSRIHLKDKWRAIKSVWNKGHWSQAEYQKLYDLVNTDLQMRAVAEVRRSKHGMIRDDIPWTAISDNLSTRSSPNCCMKWYNQLSSSMVADGVWSDTDDYRLVRALYELDSTCREDVDWDNLLEHRDGDVCRRRWGQMVLHIGHHGSKPFAEQVEILAGRYCPDLVEAREAWDSKPVVN